MPVENQHPGLLCTPKELARFREVKDIGDPFIKTSATGGFFADIYNWMSAKNETQII
jgi:hypothetical protein